MARKLYKRQKKFLDKVLQDNQEIHHQEDISLEDWDKLMAIYNWESIQTHVESYIWDYRMDEKFRGAG